MKIADAVTLLSRIGAGAAILRCSFHACDRVLVKSPSFLVEDCQFSYSPAIALEAGSDIGFCAVTDEEIDAISLTCDDFHSDWN